LGPLRIQCWQCSESYALELKSVGDLAPPEDSAMKCTVRLGKVGCLLAAIATSLFIPYNSLRADNASAPVPAGEPAQTQVGFAQSPGIKPHAPKYETIVLRGKVVELGPYLLDRHQVAVDEDAGKSVVVLATDAGEVHPLVKDVRSRGFWMDKRLRDRPMELHVQKLPGLPFVRLIDVYSFKDGKKYRVDYWCAICAITTYQPGPCPCCQDEIELRERPVDEIKPGE
jgi:hypothetical protein